DISFDDGESLIREGIKFHKSGNLKEAAGQFEIALKVYEKEQEPLNIYRISSYLSVLYKGLGDDGRAKEYSDKMVAQASGILQEEPEKIAEKTDKKVDDKKVETAQNQKNKEEEIDDPEDEVEKLDLAGIALGEKGDYNGAIKKWERACAISDRYNLNEDFSFKFVRYTHELIFDNTKVEVEETIPHIWTHLSYVYYIMGDKDNAFKYAKRLMDFSDKDTWRKVMASILMADLYSGDDYEKSLEFYNKALEYRDESVMLKYFHDTNIYDKICLLHLKYNKLDKALAVLPETEYMMNSGKDKYFYGMYNLFIKEYEKSKKYFADYINEADIHTEDELIDAYTGLGLSCEGLKQYEEAEKAYLNAISYIEEKRKRLLLTDKQKEILFSDSSCQINCGVTALSKPEYVSFFSQTLFSKLLPYESLIRVYHNLNRDRDCFYYSEAIKARILLEAIAGKHKSSAYKVPQEIIDKEKELFYSEDLEDTYEKLTKERMEEYVNSGVIEEFGEQLREYALKQEAFLKELRLKYPEYAAVKYPRPLPLDDIKLSPGEAAIEYEVIDDCTVAWLIKEGTIVKSISIPVKREELNNLVNEYRNYFSTVKDYSELSSFKPETGKKLYDLLLKDLLAEIKGEKIIIIPDEILGVLPFEALVSEMPSQINTVQGQFGPYPEGLTYVGDKYTLTYSLSLTALNNTKILSKNKGVTKGFFAVADPVFTSSDERLTGIAVNTPVPSATPVPGTVSVVTPTVVPSAPDNSSDPARDMQNNINAINTGKYKLKLMDAVADKYNINISRLPLTGEMLKDLIKIYPGEIKSFSGPDATEKNIKAH
ncbi:MAG: CHAT domain-containing protein, partial [Candidatus Eremiobacterota bacterium]